MAPRSGRKNSSIRGLTLMSALTLMTLGPEELLGGLVRRST